MLLEMKSQSCRCIAVAATVLRSEEAKKHRMANALHVRVFLRIHNRCDGYAEIGDGSPEIYPALVEACDSSRASRWALRSSQTGDIRVEQT